MHFPGACNYYDSKGRERYKCLFKSVATPDTNGPMRAFGRRIYPALRAPKTSMDEENGFSCQLRFTKPFILANT